MSKPREFWIGEFSYTTYREINDSVPSLPDPSRSDTHVIEYSAYKKAIKALKFYAERAVFERTNKFPGDASEVDVSFIARDILREMGEIDD